MFIFKRLLCLYLSVWATRKNYRVTSDCLTPKVIFLKFPTPPIWSLARTLVTLNSQISWGWWNGGGVGACWCSLQRRLSFCLRESCSQANVDVAFSSRDWRERKMHWPKPLSLYQSFRTPFDQTTHKRKTPLKKPPATQTNPSKIIERNTHTKIYLKITVNIDYW